MLWMILFRIGAAIPSLGGVVILTFILTRLLPGDPAAFFAGPTATPESIEQVRIQLGLDRSLPVQFLDYIADLGRLDLGLSLTSGQPVVMDLVQRLPATLELTLFALLLASGCGIGLGVAAALKPGGALDHVCGIISTIGQAIPTFFLGLGLVFVFYYILEWFPAPMGRLGIFFSSPDEITGFWTIDSLLAGDLEVFRATLMQIALPTITLAMFGIGPIARMTRATMIEVLQSDFVRTAKASGLPPRKILWVYAFRTAVVPVLNTVAMVLSFLLGANVLVEKVFGWPGVGAYAIEAVLVSDYAPVQGFVLLMAGMYVLINLIVDVVAASLDPRVRFDG